MPTAKMFRFRRNKSELIVLTGAIYAFVAYLTAFTLEILFVVDLTRRSSELLSANTPPGTTSTTRADAYPAPFAGSAANSPTAPVHFSASVSAAPHLTSPDDDLFLRNTGLDRFRFESIQAHITISCLATAVLYFVIFITSLVLIVALILRSTFMLLIWMCAMITMYLPEFCLVAYVSVYCWGPDTRNGQTEIAFYIFRACLNALFIFRAHKLFKQLNYEKNFFRLKSGGQTSVSSQFAGYDSPYFVGDSLTTTINPVFNSSTFNLNRYDYVRGGHFQQYPASSSRGQSPTTNNSMFDSDLNEQSQASTASASEPSAYNSRSSQAPIHTGRDPLKLASPRDRLAAISHMHRMSPSYDHNYTRNIGHQSTNHKQLGRFYLGDLAPHYRAKSSDQEMLQQQQHRASVLSINDELAECELDLDYRTLGRTARPAAGEEDIRHQRHSVYTHNTGMVQDDRTRDRQDRRPMVRSQESLPSYSTRSLDRRNLRDFAMTEQVILRPLGHQPFEYLHRPGSTNNLDHLTSDPSRQHRR